MSETLSTKDLLKYLNDLKALKGLPHFQRFMYGNYEAIEYLNDQLSNAEATDAVYIARIQGELLYRKRLQREYDDCEKLIFSLASQNNPAIKKDIESGLVPPS